MNQIWDWQFAFEALGPMLRAFLQVTLLATVLGSAVAFALGLVLALLRRSPLQVISRPTGWFIEFVRSTPLLVQLLFLYFVVLRNLPAFTIGVIGLGVHYATYTAEVYRAGIDGVPKGQWEAAIALSLPPRRKWQDVILPQAIRNVLPALGNYVISMFKETPYLLAITVVDMVAVAKNLGALNFQYLEPFTIAGLIFLAASYPSAVLIRKLEIRLGH